MSNAATSNDDELVGFLVSKLEEARERVHSFSCETRFQHNITERTGEKTNRCDGVGTIRRLQRGTDLNANLAIVEVRDEEFSLLERSQLGQSTLTRDAFLVRNNRYVAHWESSGGTPATTLTIFEHESVDRMSRDATERVKYALRVDIMEYGYALGALSSSRPNDLRSRIENSPEGCRWTAERSSSEGREVFLVKRFKKGYAAPQVTATIDPEKGYLVTSVDVRSSPGSDDPTQTNKSWKAQFEEVAPGIWFPMTAELHLEHLVKGDSIVQDIQFEVSALELDPRLPDEVFTWQALGYPGDDGIRIDVNGAAHLVQLDSSGWSPYENTPETAEARLLRRMVSESREDLKDFDTGEVSEMPVAMPAASASDGPQTAVEVGDGETPAIAPLASVVAVIALLAGLMLWRRRGA